MRWHWFPRHRESGAGLAEAAAQRARAEQRLGQVRRDIVTPLREAAEHNNFAEMIRQSLLAGHGHPGPGR